MQSRILEYLTLILACQLVGEFAVTVSKLQFPGPVAGMLLLFIFLLINGEIPQDLARVSSTLLNNLSLLFVPAGVGVMVHFAQLGRDIWPLSIAIVVSTILTIVVTALVMVLLKRKCAGNAGEET